MKTRTVESALIALLLFGTGSLCQLSAQVPQLLNYQGRIQVGTNNFDGIGRFKFALVSGGPATSTLWSNDGASLNGAEPSAAVSLPVSKGLYSVLLGDATQPNMSILPTSAFSIGDVYLRVWFSDGVRGFQQLLPDQRIAAVGYAIMASSVVDGSITASKLATGAVTNEKLGGASVREDNLADGSVTGPKLDQSIGFWKKSGQVLTHPAGVGIGTETPGFQLEVAGSALALAVLNGSHFGGTFLGLKNTSAGGDTWWLGSSGGGFAGGGGNLLFTPGSSTPKMRIDPAGNLSVTGDITARNVTLNGNLNAKNIPFIKYLQDRKMDRTGFETPRCASEFVIYELSVDVPAAGVLDIRGHVAFTGAGRAGGADCEEDLTFFNIPLPPPFPPTRTDSMAGRIALWVDLVGTDETATLMSSAGRELVPDVYGGSNAARLDVSFVLPVEPGRFTFRLKGYNTSLLGIQEKSLTAMFFPAQTP